MYEQRHAPCSARVAAQRAIEAQGYSAADAERLLPVALGGDTRTIAAVLVKLKPGADVEVVREGVEQRLFLSAFTPAEERDLLLKGRLSRMTQILGLFRTLLVIVSVVIMALIVYVDAELEVTAADGIARLLERHGDAEAVILPPKARAPPAPPTDQLLLDFQPTA